MRQNRVLVGASALDVVVPISIGRSGAGGGIPGGLIRSYMDACERMHAANADFMQGLALRNFNGNEPSAMIPVFEGPWREDVSGFWQSFAQVFKERMPDGLIQWLLFDDEPRRSMILESWRAHGGIEVANEFGTGSKYVEISNQINVSSLQELVAIADAGGYQLIADPRHLLEPHPEKPFLPKGYEDCLRFLEKIAPYLSRVIHFQPTKDRDDFIRDWRGTFTGQICRKAFQLVWKNAQAKRYGDSDILIVLEYNPGLKGLLSDRYASDLLHDMVAVARDIVNDVLKK